MKEIDQIYLNLCKKLYTEGEKVGNTLELNNVQITLNNIEENIVGIRNLSASYLFGEWLWYFTARNDVNFISKFGSAWKKLTDDGVTNNSAYGYIMMKKFGFDQIGKIIDLLRADPNSRRAVINLNTPNEDVISTKDEPCTIALQFRIRNGKLYCTTMMRSNDIWLGLPYDIAFFTELQMFIADALGVKYGTYTHFDVSLHVYERDIPKIQNIVFYGFKEKIISFDRKKFHKYCRSTADCIDSLCRMDYEPEAIRKITLSIAKEIFDYKEKEVDENQTY